MRGGSGNTTPTYGYLRPPVLRGLGGDALFRGIVEKEIARFTLSPMGFRFDPHNYLEIRVDFCAYILYNVHTEESEVRKCHPEQGDRPMIPKKTE